MKAELIKELKFGRLTPLGALQKARCLSLSQRIGELQREGCYTVERAWSRLNDRKRVRRYRIISGPK